MPINAGYEYFNAEKIYLQAVTLEEKIAALEGMIKAAPKHKSSENFLAELKTRLKKFKEKSEKAKKSGGGRKGIKKEGYQVVLLGFPSSGKSSLLGALTNARPRISPYPFTTLQPNLGTMNFEGVKAQIVDLPSIGSDAFDSGLVNTADCILEVIDVTTVTFTAPDTFHQLEQHLQRAAGASLIVLTKIDLLSNELARKIRERCKSRRIPVFFVSSSSGEGLVELQKAIFKTMHVIRVYTKEPGKVASTLPVVLPEGSTVRTVGESIRNGFCRSVKETRLTGPSSKFANQKVGLSHVLKDLDVVEFHTL